MMLQMENVMPKVLITSYENQVTFLVKPITWPPYICEQLCHKVRQMDVSMNNFFSTW